MSLETNRGCNPFVWRRVARQNTHPITAATEPKAVSPLPTETLQVAVVPEPMVSQERVVLPDIPQIAESIELQLHRQASHKAVLVWRGDDVADEDIRPVAFTGEIESEPVRVEYGQDYENCTVWGWASASRIIRLLTVVRRGSTAYVINKIYNTDQGSAVGKARYSLNKVEFSAEEEFFLPKIGKIEEDQQITDEDLQYLVKVPTALEQSKAVAWSSDHIIHWNYPYKIAGNQNRVGAHGVLNADQLEERVKFIRADAAFGARNRWAASRQQSVCEEPNQKDYKPDLSKAPFDSALKPAGFRKYDGTHPVAEIFYLESDPETIVRHEPTEQAAEINALRHPEESARRLERHSQSLQFLGDFINVVPFEIKIGEDGTCYIATKRVHGQNLHDMVYTQAQIPEASSKLDDLYSALVRYYAHACAHPGNYNFEAAPPVEDQSGNEQFVYGKLAGDTEDRIYFVDIGEIGTQAILRYDPNGYSDANLVIHRFMPSILKMVQETEGKLGQTLPKSRTELLAFLDTVPESNKYYVQVEAIKKSVA